METWWRQKKKRKAFIWGLLGLQPGKHKSKHLKCVLLDYKMEEAYTGKNCKVTVSYINCQELGLDLARSKGAC